MRKPLALFLVPALLAALLAAGTALGGHVARTVKVGDNYFVRPAGVPTVHAGTGHRVRWRWAGRNPHNVKVLKGPLKFKSRIMSGGRYTSPKLRRGSYLIICEVHGRADQSMKLKVP